MQDAAFPSFGETLKEFRQRRHLTQQQLATHLGVHRNTISSWERGDFLPENRSLVLELATLLQLNMQETRQFLEASLTTLAPPWGIPAFRNPFFTGREEVLLTLHRWLSRENRAALTQPCALYGIGGIGKTQVAVEYAYRYALEYTAALWVEVETSEQMIASVLRLADLLQLPERRDADQQHSLVAVQSWLASHSNWLLILDNLEDLDLLYHLLPSGHQGVVLITTQAQALGPLAQGLELPPMTLEEGTRLLLSRAKLLPSLSEEKQRQQLSVCQKAELEAAQEVVSILEGLPLALDQAGAYIEETGCSIVDYVERYKQQRAYLLARRGTPGKAHQRSVMATFKLVWQQVARDHPVAAELLRVCALLYAEAIPEEIFALGAPYLGSVLTPLTENPHLLDEAIAVLRRHSLLQRHIDLRTISLHRLVQAVLQEEMTEPEQALRRRRIISLLNALFPEVTPAAWEQCERLLPHVLACAIDPREPVPAQEAAQLLRKMADYQRERARYEQAEPLYQRALHIQEQAEETEYPQLARSLYGLARLYSVQRKSEQAELLYQRALHIQEQTLGAEHPDVAATLNALGILYYRQARHEQARLSYQRALRIWEKAPDTVYTEMAHALNNLAILAKEQEQYAEAEDLYLRAARLWEQAPGSEHPHIGYPLNNLANLYGKQGRETEAETLYLRVARLWEQTLGPEHPLVAITLRDHANFYREHRRYVEAEALYRQALSIREQRLGALHPETAEVVRDLEELAREQEQR